MVQLNDIGEMSKLTPKVFSRLFADEARDYSAVKRAVLTSYKLDAHYYLKQFNSLQRTGNQTYKMHLINLTETLVCFYSDAIICVPNGTVCQFIKP